MKWSSIFTRLRLVNLVMLAYFFSSAITAWREGDGVWIRHTISPGALIVCLILEILWPESLARPRAVKVAMWVVLAAVIVLMPVSISRHQRKPVPGQVGPAVPTTLQITAAQGAQGHTLEVTITGTSLHLTDGSIPYFGTGVRVLDSHNVGTTTLATHIEIAAGAPTGLRRVWVSTPGAEIAVDDSSRGAFEVLAGGPAAK